MERTLNAGEPPFAAAPKHKPLARGNRLLAFRGVWKRVNEVDCGVGGGSSSVDGTHKATHRHHRSEISFFRLDRETNLGWQAVADPGAVDKVVLGAGEDKARRILGAVFF